MLQTVHLYWSYWSRIELIGNGLFETAASVLPPTGRCGFVRKLLEVYSDARWEPKHLWQLCLNLQPPQNSPLANFQQKPFGRGVDAAVRVLTGLAAGVKRAEYCEIGRDWNKSSQWTLSQGNDFGSDWRRNRNCSSYQRQLPCLLARSLTISQYFTSAGADARNETV